MSGTGDQVAVIGPDSPIVSAIGDKFFVGARGPDVPLTSGQELQSDPILVAEVLNHCFWASLAHEEGRPVASGVTFTGPDEMGLSEPLLLETPELLTVDSLVRLGTVAGTAHRLAIHKHNGQPYIWGLLRDQGPPFWVTIWFDRPAVLRVMVEGALLLGMLDHGTVRRPVGFRFANRWNLRTQLLVLLDTPRVDVVEALSYIANEMSRHGHGGTLLVVTDDPNHRSHLDIRYGLNGASRTLLAGLRLPTPLPPDADRTIAQAIYDERSRVSRQIADLTKVDGAAVITFDLDVLGFGARIMSTDIVEKPVPKRRTIYQEDFTEVEWIKLGGTRHQSAARLVAATQNRRRSWRRTTEV
jgi:hypothetical protein